MNGLKKHKLGDATKRRGDVHNRTMIGMVQTWSDRVDVSGLWSASTN